MDLGLNGDQGGGVRQENNKILLPQLLLYPTCPPWHPVPFPLFFMSSPHTAEEHVSHIGALSRGEAGILTGVKGLGEEWRDNGSFWHRGFPGRGLLELCRLSGAATVQGRSRGPRFMSPLPFLLTSVLLLWFQPPTLLGERPGTQLPLLSYLAFFQLPVTQTSLPLWIGFPKLLITKPSFSLKQLYLAEGTVATQLEGTCQ